MTMTSNQAGKINCLQCAYYAVTWEPRHPRACKLYGFKSAVFPSVTVFQSTGEPCAGFTPKPPKGTPK